MRRLNGYPHWVYGAALTVLILLLLSGIVLIPTMLNMRMQWDTPVQVSGSVRLAGAALHSFVGFLTLALLGALAILHMRMGWRRRLNLVSGFTLVGIFGLLTLSAVAIYYLGDPDLSRASSLVHTILGLLLLGVFVWHSIIGRQIRIQNRQVLACRQQ